MWFCFVFPFFTYSEISPCFIDYCSLLRYSASHIGVVLCGYSYLRMIHFTTSAGFIGSHHFGFFKWSLSLLCHLLLLTITFKTVCSSVLKGCAMGSLMFVNTSKASTDSTSMLLGQLRTTTVQSLAGLSNRVRSLPPSVGSRQR